MSLCNSESVSNAHRESVFPHSTTSSVFPASANPSVFPHPTTPSVFPASAFPSVFPHSTTPSVFPHSTTPVANRSSNNVGHCFKDKTIKSEHFKSDIPREGKPFECALTAVDVTLCPVHKSAISDRRGQSDVPGRILGDPGQSWACLEETRVGLTRSQQVKTRLRAPEAPTSSHRTESSYRLLRNATSGCATSGGSHSSSRSPPPPSNHSPENNSSSPSAPKLHPRLPLKNDYANIERVPHSLTNNERAAESSNLFHDNSCSLYSLDELDALRGLHRAPVAVVNVQPVRSYSAVHARNNNDYSECPMEILDRKKTDASDPSDSPRRSTSESEHLRENESNARVQVSCAKSFICSRCGRCRGMCCSRKRAHLPRTYVGWQEVSAECAIDWCTCMICAHVVLDCIPEVPGNLADYDEKKFRDLPCTCCSAKNYQLWCCCLRWTAVSLMCLPCLPCLAAYWPLRGLERACARCCHRRRAKGCRCKEEAGIGAVDPTEFWINSEDSIDESSSRT